MSIRIQIIHEASQLINENLGDNTVLKEQLKIISREVREQKRENKIKEDEIIIKKYNIDTTVCCHSCKHMILDKEHRHKTGYMCDIDAFDFPFYEIGRLYSCFEPEEENTK